MFHLAHILCMTQWFELCVQITFKNLASRPFNIYPNSLTKILPLRRSTNGKTNVCLILMSKITNQSICNVRKNINILNV